MEDYGNPTSHSYFSQRLRLHYLDWGNSDAPHMLLLHGINDHCHSWDWVARRLRGRFHIIAPDLRGLWLDETSGHLERVEQCGDRVVVTAAGVIHDMRADGTLRNGVNDVNPSCMRIRNRTRYRDGVLEMDGYGIPWIRVKRWMDGDVLRWTHPTAGSHRMRRVCHVPPDRATRPAL